MVSNLEKDGAISSAECHNMSPRLCKKLELQKQHKGVTRSFILSGPSVLTQVKDSSQGDIKDKIAKTFFKALFCPSALSNWAQSLPTHPGLLWKHFVKILLWHLPNKKFKTCIYLNIRLNVSRSFHAGISQSRSPGNWAALCFWLASPFGKLSIKHQWGLFSALLWLQTGRWENDSLKTSVMSGWWAGCLPLTACWKPQTPKFFYWQQLLFLATRKV